MVKMSFTDPLLEKIIRRWKWARNNTILLFEQTEKTKTLDYVSPSKQTKHIMQPLLFQFQCIVTTTDAYYRKLIGAKNQNYGILLMNGKVLEKKNITSALIKEQLKLQMPLLDNTFKTFSYKDMDKNIRPILTISDHEYLHQGQIILMFREAGIELPKRFSTAWALD